MTLSFDMTAPTKEDIRGLDKSFKDTSYAVTEIILDKHNYTFNT